DLGKVALDALAERAIGIGEDRELALTLALYFLESEIERQLVERYGRQRALALLGQIGHVLRRNDIAIDEVLEFLVGIEHFAVDHDLVQIEVGQLRHALDLRLRKLGAEGLA